ncbi:DUF7563 family protein [Haladaptatus salinisoli]
MPRCENCETHVTPRFIRVFGDEDGEVFACPQCSTGSELFSGETVRSK